MTLEELEAFWSTLAAPTDPYSISGRRAPNLPHDRPVYIALDGQGHRHLLVQVPDGTAPVIQKETRGLEISSARYQVASNPESQYVDLACVDSSQHATFSAVVQDLLRAVQTSSGPVRDSILGALARWRAFWSNRSAGLSKEEALGLFGELWFMSRWIAPVDAIIVNRWQVTPAARHDFQAQESSVEIKTTATAGEPIHQIGSIDQLADPETGDLYMFSLHVREDGLASNSIHALVTRITSQIEEDFQALSEFNEKLALRGYAPTDSQNADRRFRVLSERLYGLSSGFPRITRTTFGTQGPPNGITNIEYKLDMAACQKWLVATGPTEIVVRRLRGTGE